MRLPKGAHAFLQIAVGVGLIRMRNWHETSLILVSTSLQRGESGKCSLSLAVSTAFRKPLNGFTDWTLLSLVTPLKRGANESSG
jgi:hypothetical protein